MLGHLRPLHEECCMDPVLAQHVKNLRVQTGSGPSSNVKAMARSDGPAVPMVPSATSTTGFPLRTTAGTSVADRVTGRPRRSGAQHMVRVSVQQQRRHERHEPDADQQPVTPQWSLTAVCSSRRAIRPDRNMVRTDSAGLWSWQCGLPRRGRVRAAL